MINQAPTTAVEWVALALRRMLAAPSEEKAREYAEIGAVIALTMKLSPHEVDTARALALAEIVIDEGRDDGKQNE